MATVEDHHQRLKRPRTDAATGIPVTGDCPAYYSDSDDVVLAAGDGWSRQVLGVVLADNHEPVVASAHPAIGAQAQATDTLVSERLFACLAMPESPVVGQVVNVDGDTVTIKRTYVAAASTPRPETVSLTLAPAVHGAVVPGDVVTVYPTQPSLTTLTLASQNDQDGTFDQIARPMLAALITAVPGIPRWTLWQRLRHVSWRRMLQYMPNPTRTLVASLSTVTRIVHRPTTSTTGARTKAFRTLDAARSHISADMACRYASTLVGVHALFVDVDSTTNMASSTTKLTLEFASSPFFISAVLSLFNAPPAALDEANNWLQQLHAHATTHSHDHLAASPGKSSGSLAVDVLESNHHSHVTEVESCLTDVVVPLTRLICRTLQRWSEVDVDVSNPVAARAAVGDGAKRAFEALHFLMTRLRAVQSRTILLKHETDPNAAAAGGGGAGWPGTDRDLACGAVLRGINETLRAVAPQLVALGAVSIDPLLPTVGDVMHLTGLSSRAWSGAVAQSYTFWRQGTGFNLPVGLPGLGPLDVAKLQVTKDRITLFSPVAHAARVVMNMFAAADSTLDLLSQTARHTDVANCAVFSVASVHAATVAGHPAVNTEPITSVGSALAHQRRTAMTISAIAASPTLNMASTQPLTATLRDCIGALVCHLAGQWFLVWVRVLHAEGVVALVDLLHEDVSTVAAVVQGISAAVSEATEGDAATEQDGCVAVAALIVHVPRPSAAAVDIETGSAIPAGRCGHRLQALLTSSRRLHVIESSSKAPSFNSVSIPAAASFPGTPLAGITQQLVPPPRDVVDEALKRLPASVLAKPAFGTEFRTSAVDAMRKLATSAVGGSLSAEQEEAVTATVRAVADGADFSTGANQSPGPAAKQRASNVAGTHFRMLLGGIGTGKTTIATIAAAAIAHALAVVRNTALPPAVDAAKQAAVALAALGKQRIATAGVNGPIALGSSVCLDAVLNVKRTQRATGPILFVTGASLVDSQRVPSDLERLAARTSAKSAFHLATVVAEAADSSRRAPLVTQSFIPRLELCRAALVRCHSVLTGTAAPSDIDAENWVWAACPPHFAAELLSATHAASLRDAIVQTGLADRIRVVYAEIAGTTQADSGDNYNAIMESLQSARYADAHVFPAISIAAAEMARGDVVTALQAATSRQAPVQTQQRSASAKKPSTAEVLSRGYHRQPDAVKQAVSEAIVSSVFMFVYRAAQALQLEIELLEAEMNSVASGIAAAQILGASRGHIAVASPSELQHPLVAATVAAWNPSVIIVDDADLAPDTLWGTVTLGSTALADPLARTAIRRAVLEASRPQRVLFVTCSRHNPALRTSILAPINAAALVSDATSAAVGTLCPRPWCNAIVGLVGICANELSSPAAASIAVLMLPDGATQNRHCRTADVSMACCALTATSGSLDADAEDAGGAVHQTLSAAGFGGSVFVITYDDRAAKSRFGIEQCDSWSRTAVQQAATTIMQYAEEVLEAARRDTTVAPSSSLKVRRYDAFPNGAPAATTFTSDLDWSHAEALDDASFDPADYLVVVLHPPPAAHTGSNVVPLGDRVVAEDQRELARICSRAQRAIVLVTTTTVLDAWPYLSSFAEVTRQLLAYRSAQWLNAALDSGSNHYPALPLECPQHSKTRSALLLRLEPVESLPPRPDDDDDGATHRAQLSFVTEEGRSKGSAHACRSVCLKSFANCGQKSHKCLSPCHALLAADDGAPPPSALFGPDENGDHSSCPYPCPKRLACGHRCLSACGLPCGDCEREVIVERRCGTSVIVGFKEGQPDFELFHHFAEKLCTGTSAELDPDAVEEALGPCMQSAIADCPCGSRYDCPCSEVGLRPLCPICEAFVDGQLRTARVEADEGGASIMQLMFSRCMTAAPQRPEVAVDNDNDGDNATVLAHRAADEDDETTEGDGADDALPWIPTPAMLGEALDAVLADESIVPANARAAVQLYWRKETLRNALLLKRAALEASKNATSNPHYVREAERVATARGRQKALDDAAISTEKSRDDMVFRTMQTALKAQVELNADLEIQTRVIVDAVHRECTHLGTVAA
jgi:hypothetical protein